MLEHGLLHASKLGEDFLSLGIRMAKANP